MTLVRSPTLTNGISAVNVTLAELFLLSLLLPDLLSFTFTV